MAKKNLKRGLALGALMAFVITGSTMAEDLIIENGSHKLNGNKTYDKVDIKNATTYALHGNGSLKAKEYIRLGAYNSNLSTDDSGNQVSLTISAPTIEMYNTATSAAVYVNSVNNSIINIIDFDRLIIDATNYNAENSDHSHGLQGNGIRVLANNNTVNVKGNEGSVVDIKASENAVYSNSNTATINISASKIIISSLGIDEGGTDAYRGHAVVSRGGTININGDDIVNIIAARKPNAEYNHGHSEYDKSAGYAIYGDAGTININMTADSGNTVIDGDIITKNDAVANVNFNGGSFKGISEGKNNLAFAQGGVWNVEGASSVSSATFGAGSTLKINGPDFTGSDYAITGTGKLAVEKGANLIIEGMEKNTYNIAKGFATNEGENFTIVNDNALMQAQMVLNKDAQELKAVVTAKSADQIVSSGIASSSAASTIGQLASDLASAKGDVTKIAPENQAAAKFLMNVMSGAASGNKTAQNMKDAMDSALNIGENLGANASAAVVANNVTGITTQRLSFTNLSTTPQGGHGKVERKYKSGEGVWAQYMHGKDKVEDMPMSDTTTTYDSQYNGIVFGYDFKEVGKTHTGIAFNYGSGDSNGATSSTHSRSEFDFWGVGLYHSIMNDDTNLVFDINYNKSDTDVTQNGLGGLVTANPKTDTISVGVKAEKLIQNGPVQIVPYAGLRYMTINTDDYRVAALNATYSPERQNVWLIPVGVSLRQENTYENGWKVTPKADLSYIWALGDTDSSMSVAVGNVAPFTNEYTVMDNGSFLGTLGIEAAKGDWTYGLSYSYQKGEYQRSDKWFVDVRYSF